MTDAHPLLETRDLRVWFEIRQPGPLTDVEHAFGAASDGEALRGRRIKRAVLSTIGAILAVGLVVSLVLYRRAEAQRAEATAQRTEAQAQRAKAVAKEAEASDLVTASYVSQGQRAALAGDGNQALVYLGEALQALNSLPTADEVR